LPGVAVLPVRTGVLAMRRQEDEAAPGEEGGVGETAAVSLLSPAEYTTPVRHLTFALDPNETYCPRCLRVVITSDHGSRCLARRGKP